MPATVNSDKMSVVHASSSGIASSFPDVCKTPSPAGPVPIPYPNIAMSSDTADGSSTVKMDGNPVMLKGSNYRMSTGDEAGAAMGVASNKIKGKAEPANYSFDVKVDGDNVYRLGDPMTTNCGGSANTAAPVTVEPPVVTFGGDSEECKRTNGAKDKQKADGTAWGESGVIGAHQGPIQAIATEEKVVIYIRRTKPECGPWIAAKHMPKPHSCLAGTTILGKHTAGVQRWLDEFHAEESRLKGFSFRSLVSPAYPKSATALIGVVGVPLDDASTRIEPQIGAGRQTISYARKWMTGDYDLFEVVMSGDDCIQIAGDAFAKLQKKINKRLRWDAIQHGPQAQWKPTPDELKPGVALFDMNVLVPQVLAGGAGGPPIDHAVTFDPNRSPMFVLDEPLTVVAGDGVVKLDKRTNVKDAMVCQGCAKRA